MGVIEASCGPATTTTTTTQQQQQQQVHQQQQQQQQLHQNAFDFGSNTFSSSKKFPGGFPSRPQAIPQMLSNQPNIQQQNTQNQPMQRHAFGQQFAAGPQQQFTNMQQFPNQQQQQQKQQQYYQQQQQHFQQRMPQHQQRPQQFQQQQQQQQQLSQKQQFLQQNRMPKFKPPSGGKDPFSSFTIRNNAEQLSISLENRTITSGSVKPKLNQMATTRNKPPT